MSYQATYQESSLERAEIDARRGLMVVEFGANWCGHCQAAQPAIREALADHPGLAHFKIEDGPGRRLGRSFRVKLWPTLILLRDGQEVARVVRPAGVAEIREALRAMHAG
jgi:thioredoxin 1